MLNSKSKYVFWCLKQEPDNLKAHITGAVKIYYFSDVEIYQYNPSFEMGKVGKLFPLQFQVHLYSTPNPASYDPLAFPFYHFFFSLSSLIPVFDNPAVISVVVSLQDDTKLGGITSNSIWLVPSMAFPCSDDHGMVYYVSSR